MEFLLILIAIGWAIFSSVAKKKQQQEAEERRKQAQQAKSQQSVHTAQAGTKPAAPYNPYAPMPENEPTAPSETPIAKPVIRHTPTPPTTVRQAAQTTMRQAAQTTMRQNVTSRLTELKSGTRHTLEASQLTGHAHQETSITGVEKECGPDSYTPQAAAPSVANASAFSWNVDAVRQGVIMAEILGTPKALR